MLLSSRTRVGEVGASWVRPVTSGSAEQWLAAVWERDLDGRRRLVKARRTGRREAEVALEVRLAQRRPLGFGGAEPNMTVQELGSTGCAAAVRRLALLLPRDAGVSLTGWFVADLNRVPERAPSNHQPSPVRPAADRGQDGRGR